MANDPLVEMLRNLFESHAQAQDDFCGEQRAWHLPRLNEAFKLACQLFPLQAAVAMELAVDPYGNHLVKRDTETGTADGRQ